jgi:hypothetical protein
MMVNQRIKEDIRHILVLTDTLEGVPSMKWADFLNVRTLCCLGLEFVDQLICRRLWMLSDSVMTLVMREDIFVSIPRMKMTR